MRGLRPLSLLAGALACGSCDPAPAPAVLDVKGTPFLVPKAAAPVEAIGDVDKGEPPPPPVAAPVTAVVAAAPAAAPVAAPAKPPADEDEPTSFDDLASFECSAFGSGEKHAIPAKIQALSGKRVVLDGYLMPLQYEAGGAKKFLLMRYKFGCCYAVSPQLNEWIECTMEKGVSDYLPDAVTTVWGVLEVKEETREGAAVGLYKMKASRTEISEAK